jgi:hypothetical protein
MRRPSIKSAFLVVAIACAFVPGLAAAGEMLSGDQIVARLSGKTVSGAMETGGAYAEYYQADGMIKAKDYTGRWSVEGDSMCFQYGSDPQGCWQVAVEGDTVEWIRDSVVEGTGTVVDGNPNNF